MTTDNSLVNRAKPGKGSGSPQAALTDAGLAVLARVASQGASAAEMAAALGIGQATLSRMRRRDQAVAAAMATPLEVPTPPSGPVEAAGRNGLVRQLAREGRGKAAIADRLGLTPKEFTKAMADDRDLLLAWSGGHAGFEDHITQGLIEQGRKGNVVANIFLAKTRLGWREQDPAQAPTTNVQIVLPAPLSVDQFAALPPMAAPQVLPPPKPTFEYEEAVIITGDEADDAAQADHIYRDPKRDPTVAISNAERLAARHAENEAKRAERQAAAQQERHLIAKTANEERIAGTDRRIARESAAAAERLAAEPPPVVSDQPLTADQVAALARARGVAR